MFLQPWRARWPCDLRHMCSRRITKGQFGLNERHHVVKQRREDKPRGGAQDWITDRMLRSLIWGLGRCPIGMRLAIMSWVMRRIVAGPVGYRDRALANLSHVWPDRSDAERDAIAEAALDNAARTIIENYDVPGLLARMGDIVPEGDGVETIERARAAGQPVLFVTGHYGNFEAARACLIARGYQIGGLYRPMSNPFFNAHYARNMHALSGPVFEQGARGTIGLIRHIKAGGMGVLLFDIYDSAGVALPFLGKPAPTLTSVADIALKTGALVVPFFGIRQADKRSFRAVFEAPIPLGDPEDMMRAITARLEAHIVEDPGQWFWIHRRWKTRPPGEPPLY